MANGAREVANDAAPAGVSDGSAPSDERSPLLQRSDSVGYSTVPRAEDVDGKLAEGKHFNLAGLTPNRFWILMSALWMCSFLVAFDGLIVATLLGSISSSFRATNLASWLGTSYMLSVCCFTPIYGRLCNIIGRQASMLIALGIFGFGNLLCAVAPSMHFLIVARAIAGMGGGGMSTVGSTVTSDLIPIHLRGIFQGLGNIAFGLGTGLGAPIGGIINDSLGWRVAFGGQIPIFILAGMAVWFNVRYVVPSDPTSGAATPRAKQTPWQLIKRIDWLGCILLAGWVGSALVAVSLKTNSTSVDAYSWSSPVILGLFAAAAVLFVIFLAVELKWAAEPVMPFEILRSRTPVSVAINNLVLSLAVFGCMYSVPLYFTAVRQMSAARAGAHLIPNAVIGMLGSLGCGFVVRHTGKFYWLNFAGGLIGIISAILLTTWNTSTPGRVLAYSSVTRLTPRWQLWIGFTPMSFSMGVVTTLTIVGLVADVGRDHIAVATSLSYVSRTLGQVLGVALSGALLQVVLQRELSARITGEGAEEIIASIRESSASIRDLPPALKAAAITSYEKGLHAVFLAAIGLSVVYTVVGLGMRNVNLKNSAPKKVDEEEDAE